MKRGKNNFNFCSAENVYYRQRLNFFKTLCQWHENFCHVLLPVERNQAFGNYTVK